MNAEPRPPLDTWRICGHPVNHHALNRGCTCGPDDPPPPWLAAKRAKEAELAKDPIKELLSLTSDIIKSALGNRYGIWPGDSDYQIEVSKLTAEVNEAAGADSADAHRDEAVALHRFETADRMFGGTT